MRPSDRETAPRGADVPEETDGTEVEVEAVAGEVRALRVTEEEGEDVCRCGGAGGEWAVGRLRSDDIFTGV